MKETRQPTLLQSTKSGVYVDEDGELNDYGTGGGVYVDGVYNLERTRVLLGERLGEIAMDVPDEVADWSRAPNRRDEPVSFRWRRRVDGGIEDLRLFPRGPRLHSWTLSRERREDDGGGMSGFVMDASGYETPRAALEAAVAWMDAVEGASSRGLRDCPVPDDDRPGGGDD